MLTTILKAVDVVARQDPPALIAGALALTIVSAVLYSVLSALFDPLRDIPGPFLSRFTIFWLVKSYKSPSHPEELLALHEKYGPVVRLAPGMYSVNEAAAVKTIYGHGAKFLKSRWYRAWGNVGNDNIFNTLDPHAHSAMKRKVTNAYSTTALINYEPYINECTAMFRERLDEAAASRGAINMHHYNQCYAFDVIGLITYSRRLGFLDRCKDDLGLIKNVHIKNTTDTIAGLFPSFTVWWRSIFGENVGSNSFVIDQVRERISLANSGVSVHDPDKPMDFIERLFKDQGKGVDAMSERDAIVAAGANTAAGSDTTGTSLSSILYHLIRHPKVMAALRQEITDAVKTGRLSVPLKYSEAVKLPLLQAVIKEAIRLHPAVGFILPRVVPAEGATLCGRRFPAGTIVGASAFVTHRNTDIWGPDAAEFKPERWLEGKVPAEIQYLSFGNGSRVCLGRNISWLEMTKLIPVLVQEYDFSLEGGDRKWTTICHFLNLPTDFNVHISKRPVAAVA